MNEYGWSVRKLFSNELPTQKELYEKFKNVKI